MVDIVAQHHGTRLVSFFWSKDRRAGDGDAELAPAFRYGGPRPQTREAGLVMIADACEASSRELPEVSPDRLLQLVRRRIAEIVDEGQLDESELTIGDLDAVARAMAGALDARLPGPFGRDPALPQRARPRRPAPARPAVNVELRSDHPSGAALARRVRSATPRCSRRWGARAPALSVLLTTDGGSGPSTGAGAASTTPPTCSRSRPTIRPGAARTWATSPSPSTPPPGGPGGPGARSARRSTATSSHGILHLVGHDHLRPGEARAMARLEDELLGRVGMVPSP